MDISFVNNINKIGPAHWQHMLEQACNSDYSHNSPFISYEFLQALEHSQSVSQQQGWQPQHLKVTQKIENITTTLAILPLYIKQHSWGEYIFDWAWAEAYERHNLPYYPKLVSAIPFTPVTCNKLLSSVIDYPELFDILTRHCHQSQLNSWHLLYCQALTAKQQEKLNELALTKDVYQRYNVQFHWFNKNYQNFTDFISHFKARKRKNTLKERASIAGQGINIRQINGESITQEELDYFYLTYQLTYLKKGHQPHLSPEFFQQLQTTLAKNMVLMIAYKGETKVACALFFYDETTLYGRYWGCTEQVKNLHFELCYYQGIEFCLEHKLQSFNPGTQGEHKIQRGFEPVLMHSYHWIKQPKFKQAISDYCEQERQQMKIYVSQCQQALPFHDTNL